jgi:Tol biopolymer transport system component
VVDRSRISRSTLALVLLVGPATAGAAASSTAEAESLILYSQAVGANDQLFVIRPDGTGRTQLTRGAADARNADWSQDGRSIAFERIPAGGKRAAVAVMAADGSGLRELTPTGYQGDPSFTPDGGSIVFTRDPRPGDNGIWIMQTDGSGLRRLTRNPFTCCDEGATVSPDGRTVTFVRSKSLGRLSAVFSVGTDGKRLRQLTPYPLRAGARHAWSPDGMRIVLTTHAGPFGTQSANVATIRRDGSDRRAVTRFEGGKRHAYAGSYSPDGRWLAIRIEEGESYGLYVVRPDGREPRRIATWRSRPGSIDWGRAG